MPFHKRNLVLFSAVIWALVVVGRSPAKAQMEPPQYVGSEACVACHEELSGSISDSAHGQLARESAPERRGCEACHGPGSNHVNSGGDKSLLFSFRGAPASAIRRQCGSCHKPAAELVHGSSSNSVHTHRTTTCLSCHAAHHCRQKKFLLVAATPQLCTDCHDRR
ncbi:MAG TPA: cytochrome c3 family protein [Terriglobales bacterium]|nr:cytochrome c3 family protein [Terriglobales bacterium]